MEVGVSAWNDFSDREKLEWLRARLLQVESTLGTLACHVDKISDVVREIAISDVVKEIEKKQKRHK